MLWLLEVCYSSFTPRLAYNYSYIFPAWIFFSEVWASIVNTVSESGIADIVIFALTAGLFAIAFSLGFAVHHYGLGGASLSAVGGVSFGIRVMLFKDDLLVPIFYVNWLISAAFGLAGIIVLAWNERVGVVSYYKFLPRYIIGNIFTHVCTDYWQFHRWILPHWPRHRPLDKQTKRHVPRSPLPLR